MAEDTSKNQGAASSKTHERIERTAERAKRQTSSAADEVRNKATRVEEGLNEATDAGARGAHRAADKAADWRARGSAEAGDMRDKVDYFYQCACDYVREKPLQSVAIALAAGWLVGRVLSSRR